MIWLASASLITWLVLIFARGGFWQAREVDRFDRQPDPKAWPAVTAVVPARDEADVICRSIGSLLAQDYPGAFRIIMVDDASSDGTAAEARRLDNSGARLTIFPGAPLPNGWTGKLWAVSQGIAAAGDASQYLWLTDADIEHAPDTLRSLVARGEAGGLAQVSLMAKLACTNFAERAIIPAFVLFFQMLYPFRWVNRPTGVGAAAGGCVLVRRDVLAHAGGIAAMRGALIDDCTLGAMIKPHGRIWLGLTDRSRSIRPYPGFRAIAGMISRSAYAQLGYSPLNLLGTVAGLVLVFLAGPILALFEEGMERLVGVATWALIVLAYQPMLRFYGRSPLWGLALPLIGSFYGGCTVLSALRHWQGRGGMWKGRAQAAAS